MGKTLASWLQIREPSDAAARSSSVTRALVHAVASSDPVRVLDLGTGTGANVRYLMPHLPQRQHWLIADRDAALLALVPDRMSSWAAAHVLRVDVHSNGCTIDGAQLTCEIETRTMDLGRLEDDDTLFEGRHVVTASALLDLTSEQWLTTLARQCHDVGAAALFALSHNGWFTCTPAEPQDELVRDLLNRHQRTDKGLGGPAAGADAAAFATRRFTDIGYHVRTERSDWMLGSSENELQRRLVDGWGDAATALMPDAADAIERWRLRRHAHIDTNRSQIVVGHIDIAVWLRR